MRQEQYPVNRYGTRFGASTCVQYAQEGTGLYAGPDLYAAKTKLDAIIQANALHEAFRYMASGNPMGAAGALLNEVQTSAADMNSLLRVNGCMSPGLRRFQQNLMSFALSRQPIRLSAPGGSSVSAQPAPAPIIGANQNYQKLVEDLVAEQAKTWIFNRFVAGSAAGVNVTQRDGAGRTLQLTARYLFNDHNQGTVTIDFSDGLPECMYFFDLHAVCKAPDHRIVDAFEKGSYQR